MICLNCGMLYDPNRTHWRCPYCGHKDHCCDGVWPPLLLLAEQRGRLLQLWHWSAPALRFRFWRSGWL